jgi:hypothetical protein
MRCLLVLALVAVMIRPVAAAPVFPVCCGMFIARTESARFNDALQFVVFRDGSHTIMSVQNRYRGPVEEFALLVPVPVVLGPDQVKVLDRSVFDFFEKTTSPTLVHMQEQDPCFRPDDRDGVGSGPPGSGMAGGSVTVESEFIVGEYQVAVLSASDAAGLDGWLKTNGYAIPPGAEAQLRPYVEAGSKFFVAKVDPTKVTFVDGAAMLSPLRFEYDAPDVTLPVRLSAANSDGVQDVIVYTIATSRLEAANRPNTTIPTGLVVTPAAAKDFGGFYAALYRRTLATAKGVVITEYAQQLYHVDPALVAVGVPAALPQGTAWNLSRLHFQVSRDGPLDDVVLRAAPPIQGGHPYGQPDTNRFAAVYEVRHPWKGSAVCLDPKPGQWFPQRGSTADQPARLATPSSVPLEQLVVSDIASLGIKGAPPTTTKQRGGGCGCRGGGDGGSLALVGLLVAVEWARRRRRCAPS